MLLYILTAEHRLLNEVDFYLQFESVTITMHNLRRRHSLSDDDGVRGFYFLSIVDVDAVAIAGFLFFFFFLLWFPIDIWGDK